jgi:hypothetical protein
MNEPLAERMTAAVASHDLHVRAAVRVATNSILRRKIGPYVDAEGWVEWDRLAVDLAEGLPWSSGEKQLARLGCSLMGQMPEHLDDWRQVRAWSLADMPIGLDTSNTSVVVEALTFALTGSAASRGGDWR